MKKIFCFLFGHTWNIYYKYNSSTKFKCCICKGYTHKFGTCYPNRYIKAWYAE